VGLSQQDLADRVGVKRSTVVRLESGESSPRPWYRPLYAEALQVSLAELDELLEQRSEATASPGTQSEPGGLLLPSGADGDTQPTAGPDYVDAIRGTAAHLIELDTQHGGDEVVQLAVGGRRRTGRSRILVAYDADQQLLARQLVQEALLASRSAGDRSMELFELAHLAMQSVHLRRPAEALRVASDVADDNRLSGLTEAAFRVRLARALGQMGQRQRSIGELRRARSLVEDGVASNDPSWTWWLGSAELAWHEGMMRADLGEATAAIDSLRAAYDLRPVDHRRARYNDLAHLLHALVDVQAWQEAESSMGELLSYGVEVSSARTAALLRRVVDAVRRGRPGPTSTLTDSADAIAAQLAEQSRI
jgi:tetratricopeptide (TPR) repeat protein